MKNDLSDRLTNALDDARSKAKVILALAVNGGDPEDIQIPYDVYNLLYHTALNARNRLRELGE
jgi:hypothetical protein